MRVVSAWVSTVQCMAPCVMLVMPLSVSGAFGGNILVLVYAADMGLCLAQPSRTRQKLLSPTKREREGVWCLCSGTQTAAVGSSFTTYAQLSLSSCHKEKIAGTPSRRLAPGRPGQGWAQLGLWRQI